MADILIADDDPILVEILKFRLEGAGHSVVVAQDGGLALETARESRPDLIVLDSMMPIMSGPAVLAALKGDPELKHIPVVMLTARDGEADIVAGLKSGAAEYLTKPFIPQELLVRISGLVEAP
ncbi:response regulator transcription factor [Alteriqipengyuania lutimaris]|uniref:Response regulator n=1 Tax=Alteriqipengyuania lutimaris TaxID=1538146 RepID=A0A395LK90_9SPHN|nr:response regulator [Alteriqipengyuania lutimaris]MBB3033605.1 DNA-binding response OmpR family regulator [Alteriqipengyuania lutimaris]RDS77398.1 response regulator [Alteriqipengyuania lutimaris]